MAFTVKPVYRFELHQEYDNAALVLNTPHFEWSGGGGVTYPTDADCLVVADAWKEVWRAGQATILAYADWKAVQVGGDGVTYDPITCRQVGGDTHEGVFTGTLVGTAAAPILPPGTAAVVSFRTGLIGKSRHGRQYIAGLPVNDQVNGVMTAGFVSAFNGVLNTFLATYGAGGSSPDWTLVIFSRVIASGCKADPVARHHPLVHVAAGDMANAAKHVTSGQMNPVLRSMRTREIGKGA